MSGIREARGGRASPASGLSVAAVGDAIACRRLSIHREPGFLRVVDLLRGADVAFANMEGLVRDPRAYPMKQLSRGPLFDKEPYFIEDLKWLGVDVVSLANNHSNDYSPEALRSSLRLLDSAGICRCGAGESLTEAREPAYVETPNGCVAVVSVAAPMEGEVRASDGRGSVRPRPGINTFRYEPHYLVDARTFEALKGSRSALGYRATRSEEVRLIGPRPVEDSEEFVFLGRRFVKDRGAGTRTAMNPYDIDDNLRWVREAKRQADHVLVSAHSHAVGVEHDAPADYMVDLAHACVEAGADAFLGHGPHTGLGIEVYESRPIFYSLGNFAFQLGLLRRHGADSFETYSLDERSTPSDFAGAMEAALANESCYSSFLARFTLAKDGPSNLTIHPLTLGFRRQRSIRGLPMLAEGGEARRIIERYRKMSARFGTRIDLEGESGLVKL